MKFRRSIWQGILGLVALSSLAYSQASFTPSAPTTINGSISNTGVPANFANASPNRLIVGDFNGDHAPDVALLDPKNSEVQIWLNRGDGSFQESGSFGAGTGPESGVVADFNGDGKLDLAIANFGVPDTNGNVNIPVRQVSVLFGNGDGTFRAPRVFSLAGQPNSIATGDFNSDGKADLAVLSNEKKSLTLLLSDGAGNFTSKSIPLPANYFVQKGFAGPDNLYGLVQGDFDADHRPDLAYVEESRPDSQGRISSEIFVLLNRGNNTFANVDSKLSGTLRLTLRSYDMNLDGKSDLAWTDSGCVPNVCTPQLTASYSLGDGTFASALLFSGNYEGAPTITDVAAGDFNRDGNTDLILGTSGGKLADGTTISAGLTFFPGLGFTRTGSPFGTPQHLSNNQAVAPFAIVPALLTPKPATALFVLNSARVDPSNPNNDTGSFQVWLNDFAELGEPCAYPTFPGVHACAVSGFVGENYIHLVASARAATPPVQRVEVWIDGKKQFQIFDDRVSTVWHVPNGNHVLDYVEVDANGRYLKSSQPFSVKGNDSSGGVGGCTDGSINFTNLEPYQTIPGTFTLQGLAYTAGGCTLTAIRLYVDNKPYYTSSESQSGSAFSHTITLSPGQHTLAFVTWNNQGNPFTSPVFPVTVSGSAVGSSGSR